MITSTRIWVRKTSGETEPYDPKKVQRSCQRAGLQKQDALKVEKKVRGQLYNGISTKEIYQHVKKLLLKVKAPTATRYGLKNAILRLGPSGFPFETYIAAILEHYGYVTNLRTKERGVCVIHEIDVIAERSNNHHLTRNLIECKYHNSSGIYTGLKETMYTYARFLDLKEGNELGFCDKYDDVWLVTNTKCSEDAKSFSKCKKIKLIGWNYPQGNGLEKMIEYKSLYPITILESVSSKVLSKFAQANMILLKNVQSSELSDLKNFTGISSKTLKRIKEEAAEIS